MNWFAAAAFEYYLFCFDSIGRQQIYRRITTVSTPSRFFTLSLYLIRTTLDDRMLSFSPAHSNCKQVAFSRNSAIRISRSKSFCIEAVGGLDAGHSCKYFQINIFALDSFVSPAQPQLPVSKVYPLISP